MRAIRKGIKNKLYSLYPLALFQMEILLIRETSVIINQEWRIVGWIQGNCFRMLRQACLGSSVGWNIVLIHWGYGFILQSGHIQESTSGCINKWIKISLLSLSLSQFYLFFVIFIFSCLCYYSCPTLFPFTPSTQPTPTTIISPSLLSMSMSPSYMFFD